MLVIGISCCLLSCEVHVCLCVWSISNSLKDLHRVIWLHKTNMKNQVFINVEWRHTAWGSFEIYEEFLCFGVVYVTLLFTEEQYPGSLVVLKVSHWSILHIWLCHRCIFMLDNLFPGHLLSGAIQSGFFRYSTMIVCPGWKCCVVNFYTL